MKRKIIATLLMFAACSPAEEQGAGRGTRYRTFVTSPQSVELHWRDSNGKQYQDFATLQAALTGKGRSIKFMMNASIFEPGGTPTGLLVIDGETLRPINTQNGEGNFYLKPNGVFWIDSSGAHITSSDEYALLNPAPRIGVQSGPLLVHNHQIHPSFDSRSENRLHRNGVGIRADGSVLFAITELDQTHRPNLHDFASFFIAQGCSDALFLDGDLSQMVVDVKQKLAPGNCFGAIFAVTEEADREPGEPQAAQPQP